MVDLSALFSSLSPERFRYWIEAIPVVAFIPHRVRELQQQHRLSDERVHELVARYEAGQSVRLLAVEFGIHRETVLEHLKRAGVSRRPNVRKLTDEQVTCAVGLYATNLSLVKVAAHFDVNAATIRREFVRTGVALRPRRGWNR